MDAMATIDPCRAKLPDLASAEIGARKFGEPWHAQVFGIAMASARAGVFTWETWVATFSAEIRRHPQLDGESGEDAYYRQWAASLTELLRATGAMSEADLKETTEHWRRSYLVTPHGKPILFRRDLPEMDDHDDDHHHDHDQHHVGALSKPVSVSPAFRA